MDEWAKSAPLTVEGSLFPNRVGQSQGRYYELDGEPLSLRTGPTGVGGKRSVAYLIWSRAE